jgi:hypothetical protein
MESTILKSTSWSHRAQKLKDAQAAIKHRKGVCLPFSCFPLLPNPAGSQLMQEPKKCNHPDQPVVTQSTAREGQGMGWIGK